MSAHRLETARLGKCLESINFKNENLHRVAEIFISNKSSTNSRSIGKVEINFLMQTSGHMLPSIHCQIPQRVELGNLVLGEGETHPDKEEETTEPRTRTRGRPGNWMAILNFRMVFSPYDLIS